MGPRDFDYPRGGDGREVLDRHVPCCASAVVAELEGKAVAYEVAKGLFCQTWMGGVGERESRAGGRGGGFSWIVDCY